MNRIWNEQDYRRWKAERPADAGDWKIEDCRSADELIKQVTLNEFAKELDMKSEVGKFTYKMVDYHFGSAEVDELLVKLKCYPDWM